MFTCTHFNQRAQDEMASARRWVEIYKQVSNNTVYAGTDYAADASRRARVAFKMVRYWATKAGKVLP